MRHALLSLLLLLLGVGAGALRRDLIRSWFVLGIPRTQVASAAPAPTGPLRPVVVLLVDGLDERTARSLPALSRLCRAGLSLRVDVGFPSVSLAVQHVLWTGAWQQRSGVLFPYAGLPRPVYESLPMLVARRSASAVAIAEAHREIVSSFPFTQIVAPPRGAEPLTPLTLQQEVLAAALGRAPLVFVHLLGVDEAGHRHGSISPQLRAAASRADELIDALWRTRRADRTLVVLSDHGHLPEGGHGDIEEMVRWAPACVVGPGVAAGGHAVVTMPDVNRLLAAQLGLPPPAASEGRDVRSALAGDPAPRPPLCCSVGAMVPGLLLAALLLAAALWLGRALRPAQALLALPWGTGLGLLLLIVASGPPSLSRDYVYPLWPPMLLALALPAALFDLLRLWTLLRSGVRRERALLLVAAAALLPALIPLALSGYPLRRPPLCPWVSGWASTLLFLGAAQLVALAVASACASRAGRR
jgi:2,3-bisphosphoglycerate-independent phosphoglycerate mutase